MVIHARPRPISASALWAALKVPRHAALVLLTSHVALRGRSLWPGGCLRPWHQSSHRHAEPTARLPWPSGRHPVTAPPGVAYWRSLSPPWRTPIIVLIHMLIELISIARRASVTLPRCTQGTPFMTMATTTSRIDIATLPEAFDRTRMSSFCGWAGSSCAKRERT